MPYLNRILLSVALAAASTSAVFAGQNPSQPNIVVILADDLGFGDLGCYGGDLPTPHIDALARDGLRFTDFYAALPTCTPTRFGLLTGRDPNRSRDRLLTPLARVGERGLRDKGRGIRPGETTLAELLKRSGYRTAMVGKWHLGWGEPEFLPTRHGFDSFLGHLSGCIDYFKFSYGNVADWYRDESLLRTEELPQDSYSTDAIAEEALDVLEKHAADGSLFLYVSFNAPHFAKVWNVNEERYTHPLQAKPEDIEALQHIPSGPHDRRSYAAMVKAMDDGVGRLIAKINQSSIASQTLVIFLSDNGASLIHGGVNRPLRDQKMTLFEGGIRVPAIFYWPGRIEAGTTTPQLASVLDIVPTVCGLTGVVPKNEPLDGIDLGPALFDKQRLTRDLFFLLDDDHLAFRRGPWKYLRHRGKDLLFHLGDDLSETRDLAGEHAEMLRELRAAAVREEEKRKGASEPSLLNVDHRALVSRADLIYQSPTEHNREGQPIGNGVMGTVVWTTPSSIHFLVNRCDQYPVDNSTSLSARDAAAKDFGRMARVTVELGGEPFRGSERFLQRLSLHDAESTIRGDGVAARCFISSERDVLALEIEDTRAKPEPFKVSIRAVRPLEAVSGKHRTSVEFPVVGNGIMMLQSFDERDYHCSGALAARIAGSNFTPHMEDERTQVLDAGAKSGKRLVLIATAHSWVSGDQSTRDAAALLASTESMNYETLRNLHRRWWHAFWQRSFVHASSADGTADYLERIRHLHLYIMACISRGETISASNSGQLFRSDESPSHWTSQHWLWNTASQYYALPAAGCFDLMEPYLGMYRAALPNAREAARQRWGCEGAFYPETIPFNGPKILPDDVAAEFRDVMRGRKPSWELSERALAECCYDSQLEVVTNTRDRKNPRAYQQGRYTWISHYATGTLDIGQQFWWVYRHNGDIDFLREQAYPILRGGMEFYRSLAGKKAQDGHYHIYPTNVRESFWGVRDSMTDLAVLRGAGPLAIRAAEILDVDEDLRAKWREFLDHLAPYPMGNEPEVKALEGGVKSADTWAAGRLGDVKGLRHSGTEDVQTSPVFPYEHVTLATRDVDGDLFDLAWRTHRRLQWDGASWIRAPLRLPKIGDRQNFAKCLFTRCIHFNPAGFQEAKREDFVSIEALSLTSAGLQAGLLQAVAPRPGEPEQILVFPCWPEKWSASFRLMARGGFTVGSSIREGTVSFVEIDSRHGETCRLRNPWGGDCVIAGDGGESIETSESILEFPTRKGVRYRVYPAGTRAPAPVRICPPEQIDPPELIARGSIGGGEFRARLGKPRLPAVVKPPDSLVGAEVQPAVPRQGLRLWLRSDRGVMIGTDGFVHEWQDQSDHGYHASAKGHACPTHVPESAYLGLPAIRFDGKQDHMGATTGLGMDLPGPFTAVVVAAVRGGPTRGIFSVAPANRGADFVDPTGFAIARGRGRSISFAHGYGGIRLSLQAGKPTGKPQTFCIVRPAKRGQLTAVYSDGELAAWKPLEWDEHRSANQNRGYRLASRAPMRRDLLGNIDLYEILVYDRVLNENELQALHSYLNTDRQFRTTEYE